ncbi:MAG: InlB B-repeat-containing protein, partial [Bacteroidales bacterium]|nr:InlB B-repeat-containing protein [Bacteroidales bacterium]
MKKLFLARAAMALFVVLYCSATGAWAENVNLANINSDLVLQDGANVTGKLNKIVKISIADGATVTLSGVTITPEGNGNNNWSGIICEGDATIILADGTENKVRSFANDRSGICVPAGKTLTIDGTGSLDVAPNANESYDAGRNSGAAGIGGHKEYNSGNIIIKNGIINARGNWWGTGIGCGYRATGGNILIEGGIVNARPGKDCGGIGCGYLGDNGTVTITKDAVVTSYKDNNGIYSIGPSPSSYSKKSTCGKVTIGCTLDGNGQPVGGHVGQVSASPFTYFRYNIVVDGGASQEVERGFDSGLTLNSLTREDYTFLGWVAENAGSKKFYPGGTKYSDLDVKPKTTITLTAQWIKGEGTEGKPYEIASADDWLTMAHYINNDDNGTYNNKHYKLTADIEVTETVAKGATPVSMFGIGDVHSFKGTFDGNKHTINLNIVDNREEHYCGPFRIISGATIKNLHVTGTIVKATWKHVGGMVGKALGTNTITNCRSSVDIQVNTDGDCSSGGFIGDLRDGQTTLTACTFDGKLRGPGGTESRSTKWGGFIGWVADGRKAVLNTCVFAPAEININNTKDCRTFARRDDGDDVTLNNCYYLQTLGSAQGSQAYSIVGDDHVNVSFDTASDDQYDVSGIDSHEGGKFIKLNGTLYSAGGKDVYLNLSQNGDAPNGYTANTFIATPGSQLTRPNNIAWYLLKMPNSDVTISLAPADFATGHEGTEADPYLIYTEEQWGQLVSRVNSGEHSGYKDKFFRLMSDITLTEAYTSGSSTVMVGASSDDDNKKFRGNFDGNGHTITLNLTDNKGDDYCGLFRFIKDATIKKLHVAGTITKSSGKYIGGLVGKAEGLNNTIRSCHSSVDILSNKDGDVSSGGFIGDVRGVKVDISEGVGTPAEWVYPATTFTDCLFDGKLRGSKAYCWGGFVGYAAEDNRLYFNNCLFNPAEVSIDTDDNSDNSRTLARMYQSSDTNIHPSNCYYKLTIKETQGALSAGSMTNDEL